MIIGPANGYWLTPIVYISIGLYFALKPRISTLFFCLGASLCLNATALINVGYFIRVPVVISVLIAGLYIPKYSFSSSKYWISINHFGLLLFGFMGLCFFSALFYYLDPMNLNLQKSIGDNIRHGLHRPVVINLQLVFVCLTAVAWNRLLQSPESVTQLHKKALFKGIFFGFYLDFFYALWEGAYRWFSIPFINLTNDLSSYWEMGSMFGNLMWHRVRSFDLEPLNLMNYALFVFGMASLQKLTKLKKKILLLMGIILWFLTFSRGATLAMVLSVIIIMLLRPTLSRNIYIILFKKIFIFGSVFIVSILFFNIIISNEQYNIPFINSMIERYLPKYSDEFGLTFVGRGDPFGYASIVEFFISKNNDIIKILWGSGLGVSHNSLVFVLYNNGIFGFIIIFYCFFGWILVPSGRKLVSNKPYWCFFFIAANIQRLSFIGIVNDIYTWISIGTHFYLIYETHTKQQVLYSLDPIANAS